MSTKIGDEVLVNGRELAKMLHVSLKTVINYHQAARDRGYPEGLGKFPKPHMTVEGHPLWLESDAQDYASNRPSARRAVGEV